MFVVGRKSHVCISDVSSSVQFSIGLFEALRMYFLQQTFQPTPSEELLGTINSGRGCSMNCKKLKFIIPSGWD